VDGGDGGLDQPGEPPLLVEREAAEPSRLAVVGVRLLAGLRTTSLGVE